MFIRRSALSFAEFADFGDHFFGIKNGRDNKVVRILAKARTPGVA